MARLRECVGGSRDHSNREHDRMFGRTGQGQFVQKAKTDDLLTATHKCARERVRGPTLRDRCLNRRGSQEWIRMWTRLRPARRGDVLLESRV